MKIINLLSNDVYTMWKTNSNKIHTHWMLPIRWKYKGIQYTQPNIGEPRTGYEKNKKNNYFLKETQLYKLIL